MNTNTQEGVDYRDYEYHGANNGKKVNAATDYIHNNSTLPYPTEEQPNTNGTNISTIGTTVPRDHQNNNIVIKTSVLDPGKVATVTTTNSNNIPILPKHRPPRPYPSYRGVPSLPNNLIITNAARSDDSPSEEFSSTTPTTALFTGTTPINNFTSTDSFPVPPDQINPQNSVVFPKDLARIGRFRDVYEQVVKDTKINHKFTLSLQFKWCLVLIYYSFNNSFLQHYNINAVELPRPLNVEEEMVKNQKIILEHSLKVLSKLCSMDYPLALYFMGTLYSHQLDNDLNPLLDDTHNDKGNKIVVDCKKILPKNDIKALEYYEESAKQLEIKGVYRSGVCYELGKGCPSHDIEKSLQYYQTGWFELHDKLCGFKLGSLLLKYNKYDNDNVSFAIEILKQVNNEQSLFELGKYYELVKEYQASLEHYHRSATLKYPLACWKMGQIHEFGFSGINNLTVIDPIKSFKWYNMVETPLTLLGLSGWYLTGIPNFLPSDEYKSFELLLKSSKLGTNRINKIEYGLAIYYQYGIGCNVDSIKSSQHMYKAARLGHQGAIEFVKNHKEAWTGK
ncbi:uncharacterized protein SCODWIG_01763 [Saccharomycodes ludwigii]|uniref:Activator of C kinase protein 1 n=1 Tax=Saccharomycodes ludwigii TaxID=36035 RepID=A0A376B5U2_9ASCO|nr:hypothetical protein SCDLUD_001922 [Saccharomycodes ludwigii]KAH3902109.1 hypothetical protein SCDLUD_001922 [Saccharomycodes ludwigii]SSD60002.1 uncharacterized protein SCODWIG_01763 [Saccharomycodes ludwigii]